MSTIQTDHTYVEDNRTPEEKDSDWEECLKYFY